MKWNDHYDSWQRNARSDSEGISERELYIDPFWREGWRPVWNGENSKYVKREKMYDMAVHSVKKTAAAAFQLPYKWRLEEAAWRNGENGSLLAGEAAMTHYCWLKYETQKLKKVMKKTISIMASSIYYSGRSYVYHRREAENTFGWRGGYLPLWNSLHLARATASSVPASLCEAWPFCNSHATYLWLFQWSLYITSEAIMPTIKWEEKQKRSMRERKEKL